MIGEVLPLDEVRLANRVPGSSSPVERSVIAEPAIPLRAADDRTRRP
jgi:hypothetical protein